jgi:hypothetical protein
MLPVPVTPVTFTRTYGKEARTTIVLLTVAEVQLVGFEPSMTNAPLKAAHVELFCDPSSWIVAAEIEPATCQVSRHPAQPCDAPAVLGIAAPAVAPVKVSAWEQFGLPCANIHAPKNKSGKKRFITQSIRLENL